MPKFYRSKKRWIRKLRKIISFLFLKLSIMTILLALRPIVSEAK